MNQHKNLFIVAFLLLICCSDEHITDLNATDDCSVITCTQLPECPSDSYLKTANFESIDGPDTNYSELFADSEDSNPFYGIAIEPLDSWPSSQSKEITPSRYKNAPNDNTAEHATTITETPNLLRARRELLSVPVSSIPNEKQQDEYNAYKHCCMESECTCKPCGKIPKCLKDEVAVVLVPAKGIPGACCDTIKCISQWQCEPGKFTGKQQEQIFWRDSCTKCKCTNGDSLCFELCPHDSNENDKSQEFNDDTINNACYSENLKTFMHNRATWFENNYCTECTCFNGRSSCTESLCKPSECDKPIKLEGHCCPVCNETTTPNTTAVPNLLELQITTNAVQINIETTQKTFEPTTDLTSSTEITYWDWTAASASTENAIKIAETSTASYDVNATTATEAETETETEAASKTTVSATTSIETTTATTTMDTTEISETSSTTDANDNGIATPTEGTTIAGSSNNLVSISTEESTADVSIATTATIISTLIVASTTDTPLIDYASSSSTPSAGLPSQTTSKITTAHSTSAPAPLSEPHSTSIREIQYYNDSQWLNYAILIGLSLICVVVFIVVFKNIENINYCIKKCFHKRKTNNIKCNNEKGSYAPVSVSEVSIQSSTNTCIEVE